MVTLASHRSGPSLARLSRAAHTRSQLVNRYIQEFIEVKPGYSRVNLPPGEVGWILRKSPIGPVALSAVSTGLTRVQLLGGDLGRTGSPSSRGLRSQSS